MKPHAMTPLFDRDLIATRIKELAEQIEKDSKGKEVIVIGVLKGSFIFVADLIRQLSNPVQVEFIAVSSYEGTSSSGRVRLTYDLSADISGKHVLLVEDVVDTGRTIDYLLDMLQLRGAASLRVCTLLSKPEVHDMKHKIDYVGFEISEEFVVGYGLDLDGNYRHLPDIMQIKT